MRILRILVAHLKTLAKANSATQMTSHAGSTAQEPIPCYLHERQWSSKALATPIAVGLFRPVRSASGGT
jgi:hypothetical protein